MGSGISPSAMLPNYQFPEARFDYDPYEGIFLHALQVRRYDTVFYLSQGPGHPG